MRQHLSIYTTYPLAVKLYLKSLILHLGLTILRLCTTLHQKDLIALFTENSVLNTCCKLSQMNEI